MMALKRVGAPVPSPDGKWVVFAAEDVDLEANTRISHLWIVPATGGESKRFNETKMLYFPDEGHWVLKPQNSRL